MKTKLYLNILVFINIILSLIIIFITTPYLYNRGSYLKMKTILPTIVESNDNVNIFGLPVRLKIPKINVDSVVEHVGLTNDGTIGTPADQNNVAWFNLGQRPGDNGSAVMSGHYGWKDGKESVFDNLYKLRKGDQISVEDDKGIIINFVVREIRRYDVGAVASSVFVSVDDSSHLNLITCEGDWNKNSNSYSQRLVVFADRE